MLMGYSVEKARSGLRIQTVPAIFMALLVGTDAAWAQVPTFEAVSVKPSAPDSKGSQTTYDPGMLIAHGVSLKQLVEWAYQVTPVQVSGGPGWVDSKSFDLTAKADGEHSKDELLLMLRPVLSDRFKLALHPETKEMPVYVLTAGPNRSKLQEAKGGPANIAMRWAPPVSDKEATLEIVGQSVSMQFLTDYLSGIFDRVFVDRTGLKGSFDFKTEVDLEQDEIRNNKRAAVIAALSDALPRLGFKLESRKEPLEILLIDHAEEPSAN
jgi:uncharacterized protein (TIGR03435 family)